MLKAFWPKLLLLSCTALLVFFVPFSHQQVQAQSREVPTIDTTGGAFMSIERERLVGEHYMREVRGGAPIIEDPVLREYLSGVGNRLVRHADNVRYPFHFFWIRDDSINAFAFLGGYIGVHSGLMLETRDESELAAVLSHEIAHVTQRHIARNMERMTASAPLTLAQVLGGILIGIVNPQVGMAVLSTGLAGAQQRAINYTRQFELEADRVGMTTLARAGYDPEGAPRFFGRLATRYRYATQLPQFLMTHPLPESRIADTQSRAQALGARDLEPALDYELAKMRLRVRYSNRSARDLLLDFNEEARRATHPIRRQAVRYGTALALHELKRFDEAEAIITELLAGEPMNLFYLDTRTDVYVGQKQYSQAVEWLTREYMRRPNNQVVTLNLAYAANYAGDYQLSRTLLNDYLIHNKQDVVGWQLLQEAHQRSGNAVAAHEATAEILALRSNFRMAIEELHSAFSKTPESQTASRQRIQARVQQFRALEAEKNRAFDF